MKVLGLKMPNRRLYSRYQYIRKIVNSFFPKILFRLSPIQFSARLHWKNQNEGDLHGFDKYICYHTRVPIIISEIKARVPYNSSILDIGCNCGYYLSLLKKEGFNNLSGVDISPAAIQYGKEHFDLKNVNLTVGSFEEVFPVFSKQKKQYDLVYSLGATIELVHPSFDIVGSMCEISKRYIVLIISEWGHDYPRFWEYEFNRNGFSLVKSIRPYDGKTLDSDYAITNSLMVFQRI